MTPINDLLTAAAAKLGKNPWEVWPRWYLTSTIETRCSECHSDKGTETIDLGYGDKRRVCENCGVDLYADSDTYDLEVAVDPPRFIGPDLTQPEHLNDALEVADALCRKGARCELVWDFAHERFFARIPIKLGGRIGGAPTRIAAVRAAIEEACK